MDGTPGNRTAGRKSTLPGSPTRLDTCGASSPSSDRFSNAIFEFSLGDPDSLMEMIEGGLDPNRPDRKGMTPLHYAARNGYTLIARELLAKGAHHKCRENYMGFCPIHLACLSGRSGVLKVLVEAAGADAAVRTEDRERKQPLHFAATSGVVDVVAALLELGADVNAQDDRGVTPLAYAVSQRSAPLIRMFIVAGADVQIPTYAGITALHKASGLCDALTSSLLLAAGADETARNSEADTPAEVIGVLIPHADCRPKTDAEMAGYLRLLARAPAFRACSWRWPTDVDSASLLASLLPATGARLSVRLFRRQRKDCKERTWTPIAGMFRYCRK